MSKINKDWHLANKMPPKATVEQRVKWHKTHQKYCHCHPGYPAKLKEEAVKKGINL